LCSLQAILEEIKALDEESAEILNTISELIWTTRKETAKSIPSATIKIHSCRKWNNNSSKD
jgi:uncharacterized protein YaaN involved in tellurite resistance